MKNDRNKWIVFLLMIFFVFYIFSNNLQREQVKKTKGSSYSRKASGHTVLQAYIHKYSSLEIFSRPVLDITNLDNKQAMLLLNPKAFFGEREIKLIKEYIKSGGHLFITSENEGIIKLVLYNFFKDINILMDDSFTNGQIKSVSVEDHESLPSGDYSIYSSYIFDDKKCDNNIHCYYQERSIGKGKVILFLGISPLSNYLINNGDNYQIAQAISEDYSSIMINEYLHFHTDKNFIDLLMLPEFIIPVLGILLALMSYYLWGRHGLYNKKEKGYTLAPVDLHEYNEQILFGLFNKKQNDTSMYHRYISYLEKTFPKDIKKIEHVKKSVLNNNDPTHMINFNKLETLHRKLYANKTRLRGLNE